MLCAQNFHQIEEYIGLFETGEEKVFLEFLVIILNNAANYSRGISERFG